VFPVLRYFSIVSGVLIVGVGGLLVFTFLTVEAGEREALEASHQDIHILGAHIDYSIRTVVTALVALLGALYAVLFLIVARADRILRSQYSAVADSEAAGTMSFSGATTRDEGSPEAALAAAGAECRAAGGSFVVQSSAGVGTTVSFALPQRDILELVPEG
jgi:hypothetical protein